MLYIMNEPAKADIRGSSPLAFAEGRLRRITAAATSNRNAIVGSRIAIWPTSTVVSIANCFTVQNSAQTNKGRRNNKSYVIG